MENTEIQDLKRELKEISLEKILIDLGQPRQKFDPETIKTLAISILKEGLLHPIVVKPSPNYEVDKTYIIVSGERRYKAYQYLQRKTIPAIVIEKGDTFALSLVENVVREDLNPIEEAKALQKLIYEKNYSQKEAADLIGRSPSYISQRLLLLRLPTEIQDLIIQEKLPPVTALRFSSYTQEKKKIIQLAHDLINAKASPKQAEAIIKAILGQEEGEINPDFLQIEKESLWKKDQSIVRTRTHYLDSRYRLRRISNDLQQLINLSPDKRKICLNSINEEARLNLLLKLLEFINLIKILFELEAEISGSGHLLKFYEERSQIIIKLEEKKTEAIKEEEMQIETSEWLKPIWEMLLHPAGPSLNLKVLQERTNIQDEKILYACLNGGIKILSEIWNEDNDGYGEMALKFRDMIKSRWPEKKLLEILAAIGADEQEKVQLNILSQ